MQPYSTLSHAGQVRRLKRLGAEALRAWPVEGARLAPLTHEENTTFRVETPGGERYVLRIHRPAKHTADEIRAEMTWLAALRRDTALAVPEPVATRSGAWLTEVAVEGVPEARVCVLLRWMDGRFLDDGLTATHLERVGAFTARLHEHARRFTPPAGFARGRIVRGAGGVREQDDLHSAEARTYITRQVAELCSPEAAGTVEAVLGIIRQVCADLGEGPETFGLIHADLHQWNYLFHQGEVRAIDFDDCGYGPFVYDLGTTLSEVHHRADYATLQAALLAGYRRVRPLPAAHEAYLETFVALRELQLLLWRLELREHPAFSDWQQKAGGAIRRLGAFVAAQGGL
jgi:Ser/Thr protein kinase RdoA (MazF antagonist)